MIRYLKIEAPIARFAPLSAGSFVPTLPTISYSAAYGLLMNLAGQDLQSDKPDPARGPTLRLAIGVQSLAPLPRSRLLHHLHIETVGASGEVGRSRAHGTKPWIAPGTVEFLSGFKAILAIEAKADLLGKIDRGLRGEGLFCGPNAGESNLLYETLEWIGTPPPLHYYVPLRPGDEVRCGSCRLPIFLDRRDQGRCRLVLVAPTVDLATDPPAAAWVEMPG